MTVCISLKQRMEERIVRHLQIINEREISKSQNVSHTVVRKHHDKIKKIFLKFWLSKYSSHWLISVG